MPYSELLRGRASIGWQIYLVTTVTRRRIPLFSDFQVGRTVVRTLHCPAIAASATTLAYVVMPDHLHWLVQLHPQRSLSHVVGRVKGSSALEINRFRRARGPVWEVGFHDHGIRREEDLQDVARYVVCNPVRARLVQRIHDYPLWDAVWVAESG